MICWWTHIGLPSLSLSLCLSLSNTHTHTHTNQVCKELWVWVNITSQQFWGVKIALALQDILNFLLNIITLAWLCMETTPMRMHTRPPPTHTHSHVYCLCAVSLCQRQTYQVHTTWLPMWCSSSSSISLDRGPSVSYSGRRMVTLCWLLSWGDVSNSNWDLWPPPRGVQLSYLWMWVSMSVRLSVCFCVRG